MKSISLIVLAGGFGTRLRTAVSDVPKPLAPVMGRPYLAYLVESWLTQGVTSMTFLLHHQADVIIDFLRNDQDRLFKDCEVHWLVEPAPMGTGGAVAYAVEQLHLSGDFLVINADTWLGTGIKEVWQADSPAMAVVKVEDTGRYGSVQFDDKNLITAFHEKSAMAGTGWINAGLCHLKAELFKEWNHEPFSLEQIRFPIWADQSILKAVPLQANFIDIGVPEDYFRFCRWIESGKKRVV